MRPSEGPRVRYTFRIPEPLARRLEVTVPRGKLNAIMTAMIVKWLYDLEQDRLKKAKAQLREKAQQRLKTRGRRDW